MDDQGYFFSHSEGHPRVDIFYARNSEVAKEITAYACMHSGVKTLLTMTTNKTEFQQYLRQINGADSEFYLIKYKPHPVMDRI